MDSLKEEIQVKCADIEAIILDIRGTTLHSEQDIPASFMILMLIHQCRQMGIIIALVSGCSRKTIEELILQPFKRFSASFGKQFSDNTMSPLYVYSETGSQGYITQPNFSLLPLINYSHENFTPEQIITIKKLVEEQSQIHKITVKSEERASQINSYCVNVSDRKQRLNLARDIETHLQELGMNNVTVNVPTSKSVIDISLGRKTTAVKDLIQRNNLNDHSKVLFISDSLQQNGADAKVLSIIPTANAIHVGGIDAPLWKGVIHIEGGTKATEMVLSYVVAIKQMMPVYVTKREA